VVVVAIFVRFEIPDKLTTADPGTTTQPIGTVYVPIGLNKKERRFWDKYQIMSILSIIERFPVF